MAGYIGSKSSVVLNAGATADQGTLADTAVQPADNISTLTNDAGYLTVAPAPFVPLAVTGTTPSLDVGTYNFFDNGALTGDTTVTFASVPTQAKWTYTCATDFLSTWDTANASYDSLSVSVSVYNANPTSVSFKPDGTKMYVIGHSSDKVTEFSLSTAWDVSTASYVRIFSVAGQETSPSGLFFKPDGTKMYVTGYVGNDVTEYSLSTAWDVSTASYVRIFSVSSRGLYPEAVFFKPDGTKMYTVCQSNSNVSEYSLSTAWNVSTTSYVRAFNFVAQGTWAKAMFFKTDGLAMFIQVGATDIVKYSLSTAWDVSTASYVSTFNVSAQDTNPTGLFFKDDGSKMYVSGRSSRTVYQYTISTLPVITLPVAVENPPTLSFTDGDRVTYDFYTLDGGTNVYLIGEEVL